MLSMQSMVSTRIYRFYSSISFSKIQQWNVMGKSSIYASLATTTTPTTTGQSNSNWREWFRSSDYDNPWSSYCSFQDQNEISNNTINNASENSTLSSIMARHHEKYQRTIVPSVLGLNRNKGEVVDNVHEITNTPWQRRRHGMNLEPLNLLTIKNPKDSIIESNVDNENFEEYLNKIQTKMRRMDVQTRFLCQMLDDLYRTGIWRVSDQPTVERCHRAIGRLLMMTPGEYVPRGNNISSSQLEGCISITGLAPRAGAILQRMEDCTSHSYFPVTFQENNAASSEQDVLRHEPKSQSCYQDVYPNGSPHLFHTKFKLPFPTREIYNMVLLAYSKEVGPLPVAEQAEDIIWSMIDRARKQQVRLADNKPMMNCVLPSVDNWNCVLKCWARSTDRWRSFYAYSFLQSWMEYNNQYKTIFCAEGNGVTDDAGKESEPNLDSLRIVLSSCLITPDNNASSQELDISHAKRIGSGVAMLLWKEMQNFENDSATYLMLLQAICQTPELPTTMSSSKSLKALARVYVHCCRKGMITHEISNVVKAATTKSQFAQIQAMAEMSSTSI